MFEIRFYTQKHNVYVNSCEGFRVFSRPCFQNFRVEISGNADQGSGIGNISPELRSGFEDWEYSPEMWIRVRGLGIFHRNADEGSRIRRFLPAAKTNTNKFREFKNRSRSKEAIL